MSTLTEMTAQIITARAGKKDFSTEEFQHEMQMVYNFLKGIETGTVPESVAAQETEEAKPQKINFKQFFKKDEVICLICNKGFKTLKRHLLVAHELKPGQYRKQFNIPAKYTFVATAYSEQRKKDALDRGQGEILAKARAVRAANIAAAPAAKTKSPATAAKAKAAVAAKKVKKTVTPKPVK